MKATTIAPTRAPINSVRTRKTCSSRCCKRRVHCQPVLSTRRWNWAVLRLPSSLAILRALAYLTDDTTIRRPGCDFQHSSRFCVVTIGKFEDSYEGLDCKSLH